MDDYMRENCLVDFDQKESHDRRGRTRTPSVASQRVNNNTYHV